MGGIGCKDCQNDADKKGEVIFSAQSSKLQALRSKCPGDHGLLLRITDSDDCWCNVCGDSLPGGEQMWECLECDYAKCAKCKEEGPWGSNAFFNGVLEGVWYRKGDRRLLGRLEGNSMKWDPLRHPHPPSLIKQVGAHSLSMCVEGMKYQGILAYTARSNAVPAASTAVPIIRWSDGEIWVKDL
eukprot:TRINITY_DN35619_c0_g1_i1.p1 TRINITY_DN35619_c0_g1~~TRINITY_DN35619_c0_g1_i1.p1  ORF type:complete len:184 (-),score=31.05 TRINITY_DN35619_c0_g1_i1:34-585(-)